MLARLAAHASDRPFFLGYHLRLYATRQVLTNAALARWLGCSEEVLARVRLCRAPKDRGEAGQIAERSGVSAEKLIEAVGL